MTKSKIDGLYLYCTRFAETKKEVEKIARQMRSFGGVNVAVTGQRGLWRVRGKIGVSDLAKFCSDEAQGSDIERFPWCVGACSYRDDGKFNYYQAGSELDLIAEYVEAKQEEPQPPSIDPGEGWRLLDIGEPLQPGDQFFSNYDNDWHRPGMAISGMLRPENTPYRRRIQAEPKPSADTTELTALRQQCQRQAERIEELELLLSASNPSQSKAWREVKGTLDRHVAGWHPDDSELSPMEAACKAIRDTALEVKALEKVNANLLQSISNKNDQILALQDQVRSAEEALLCEKRDHNTTANDLNTVEEVLIETRSERDLLKTQIDTHTLRWERRQPTEEECRERWILLRKTNDAIPPGMTDCDEWYEADEICVLPHIAEPEPQTITQRRWLVRPAGSPWFVEAWVVDGEEPCDPDAPEMIETDKTREVKA